MSGADGQSTTCLITATDEGGFASLCGALRERFGLDVVTFRERLTVLDTFDWRLYRAERELLEIRGETRMLSVGRPGMEPEGVCDVRALPRWASDLPEGFVWAELGARIAERALLPQLGVERRGQQASLLSGEGKTIAQVVFCDTKLGRPNWQSPTGALRGRRVSMGGELRLLPVFGHDAEFDCLLRAVRERVGTEPTPFDALTHYGAALDLAPGQYSSKLSVALDPMAPAGHAFCQIFEALVDTFDANEGGTRLDLDSEFLHDYRVASRRCRSLLAEFDDWLPQPESGRLARELKWLGQLTGPVRDADVFALLLDEWAADPAGNRGFFSDDAWAALRTHLGREHERVRRPLLRAMNSRRYERLKTLWMSLAEPGEQHARGNQLSIQVLASARIWKAFRRIRKRAAGLSAESPSRDIHSVRIAAKRLRYLLEFFRSAYPAQRIDPLVSALKQLQDQLGLFNDLDVQADMLRMHAQPLYERGVGDAELMVALGQTIGALQTAQRAVRHDIAKALRTFNDDGNRRAYRRLFRASKK
ncbi:MAG: CHAD domain-containing protein [Pseudomonadota bacterium]